MTLYRNSGKCGSSLDIEAASTRPPEPIVRPIPSWTVELAGGATLWLLMKSATDHTARRPGDGKLLLRVGKTSWVVTIVVFFIQPVVFLEILRRKEGLHAGDLLPATLYALAYMGPGLYVVANMARRWALVDGWGVVARPLWGSERRMAWHDVTEVETTDWSLVLKAGPYKQIRIPKYVVGLHELLQEVRVHVPDHICEEALQKMARKMGIRDQ